MSKVLKKHKNFSNSSDLSTLPNIAKDELNKEGCGRVCFWQELGIVHSYTLECNYQTGKRINHLNQRVDSHFNNRRLPDLPMQDISNKIY